MGGVEPHTIGSTPQNKVSTGLDGYLDQTGIFGVAQGLRIGENLWVLAFDEINSTSLRTVFSNRFTESRFNGLTLSHSLSIFGPSVNLNSDEPLDAKVSIPTKIAGIASPNPTLLHHSVNQQLVRS
ncbi:MAG: hypothetical protein HKL80_07210 [Acidimicrobiales bacterium]|nr:hypothetical protein [Acidimicrobiales bacterium]